MGVSSLVVVCRCGVLRVSVGVCVNRVYLVYCGAHCSRLALNVGDLMSLLVLRMAPFLSS